MQYINTQHYRIAKEIKYVWTVTAMYSITTNGSDTEVTSEVFVNYEDAAESFRKLIPKEPAFSRSEHIRLELYPESVKYSIADYVALKNYTYYKYDEYNEPMVGGVLMLSRKVLRTLPLDLGAE